MRRAIISVLIFGLLTGVTACSDKRAEPAPEKKPASDSRPSVHGADSGSGKPIGTEEILKQKTLPDFPSATIGKAFDSYGFFKNKQWRETRSNGKIYIDFIGTLDAKILEVLKTDVTLQTVTFKFVIIEDGQFGLVMVSREDLMKDGTKKTFVVSEMKSVLAKIYGNQEIKF